METATIEDLKTFFSENPQYGTGEEIVEDCKQATPRQTFFQKSKFL